MLDIIITHYREPWEVCKKQFWMLDMQRRVDWREVRVTIVNDGGCRLPEEELNRLSFPVEHLDIPHGGISAARNAGIDHATEPWIMFCDCDDCFANIYALDDIMSVMQAGVEDRFDVLWSKCLEEGEAGIVQLIPGFRTFVFCHGKAYSRSFLLREGIRFEEGMTFNEDSCFNAVIVARTQRVGEIRSHAPVYAWIRRPGSVTTDPARHDESTICNFRRNMIVTEENRLHRPDQYPAMVARTVYDAFHVINGDRITASCKQKILDEFVPWIRKRVEVFDTVETDLLDKIREISSFELSDGENQSSHEQIRAWVTEVAG